jgi:hypothetical protein
MKKIDILYIYNFELRHKDEALKRLNLSLDSIKNQNVRICISNNSEYCIFNSLENHGTSIRYIHKPYHGKFSRAHGINFAVKNLIETEYFIISDIDLIYQENHIQLVQNKILNYSNEYKLPVRIVFWNLNLEPTYSLPLLNIRFIRRFAQKFPQRESSSYQDLVNLKHNGGGFAHGNGVIHYKSFLSLRGYDEELIGYGPEDDLFNTRISFVNKVIYDEDRNTSTIHLWHPRLRMLQFRKNMKIWKQKKEWYLSLQNPSTSDLTANKDISDWGII